MSISTIAVANYSLVLVILGTTFNLLTFAILCRSKFRRLQFQLTLNPMRVMAIVDILMLYGWNFDHYLNRIFGFTLQRTSMSLCRFLSFFNYFLLQSSAWLRVFVCFERYLSLTRFYPLCFNDLKRTLIILGGILIFFALFNSIFLIYGCSFTNDGQIQVQSWAFAIYPLWNHIHLVLYNFLPFILMTLFNIGIIYQLIRHNHNNLPAQYCSITLTLLLTTILFLIMTLPSTVALEFVSTSDVTILNLLDCILYTYHILSLPLYLITYRKFRREFFAIIRCKYKEIIRIRPIY